jgi:hypothetical protein
VRPAFKPKGNQPLTQADQSVQVLQLIWGCDDRRARDLDADDLCRQRGISDKRKRLDIIQAVAARKGRLK